jgi:recombinational DNA repair protein (RecF pathway)
LVTRRRFKHIRQELKTPAIVIRVLPSGDSDLIIRCLSADHGKLSVFCRKGRATKKAHVGRLDLFDYGIFELKSSHGELLTFFGYTPLRGFPRLREDLDKLLCASYVIEVLDLLIQEGIPDQQQNFQILHLGLTAIESSLNSQETLKALFFTLLRFLEGSGIFGGEHTSPSVHNLRRVMRTIREFVAAPVQTEEGVMALVNRFTQKNVSPTSTLPAR